MTESTKPHVHMLHSAEIEPFLARNGLSKEVWAKSGCDWALLAAIGSDYQKHSVHLQESAELFARVIQRLPRVHSVRWRVKDIDHLLAKIVRKKADDSEKYRNISPDNYHQIVTDLIGIRALHLFKDECIEIDAQLRALWTPTEVPVVYIRDGDQGALTQRFAAEGFEVRSHPAGYRSVHYVIEARPLNRSIFAELQVRTIFEEAWSEIDHRVRYPSFSQSELVAYFLSIFNRLSGSADEMGGFVRGLASSLKELEDRAAQASLEKQEALTAMEGTLGEMEKVRKRDRESGEQIERLKSEIERLKRSNLVGPGLLSPSAESEARPSTPALDALSKVARRPSFDLEKLAKIAAGPAIDFEKLTKMAAGPAIDFERLMKLAARPPVDFERLAKMAAGPSIDLERLAKLAARPSIDLEKLAKATRQPSMERQASAKDAKPSQEVPSLSDASDQNSGISLDQKGTEGAPDALPSDQRAKSDPSPSPPDPKISPSK